MASPAYLLIKKKDLNVQITLTWLLAFARLAISRCSNGMCDFKNGKTYGRSGKLAASWIACLNSSAVKPPLC